MYNIVVKKNAYTVCDGEPWTNIKYCPGKTRTVHVEIKGIENTAVPTDLAQDVSGVTMITRDIKTPPTSNCLPGCYPQMQGACFCPPCVVNCDHHRGNQQTVPPTGS